MKSKKISKNLKNVLNEVYNLFEVRLILKVKPNYNATEVAERIRAIKGVTIVRFIEDDRLLKKNTTTNYEYYLVSVKYIHTDKGKSIDIIRSGLESIEGLLSYKTIYNQKVK